MDLVERFIKYVKIDTESDPNSSMFPTTEKQKDLGKVLVDEMLELGISDAHMTNEGIVYGSIPKNVEGVPAIGFIAHMDTSPDMSGKNVNPRIIKNYDGGKIILNEQLDITMDPVDFPSLKGVVGDDLIVTDGTTLLGADDKAGIAEIMDLAEKLMTDPTILHGDIKLAFTPDEEVGAGVVNFDVEKFGAEFAYTVDGGEVDCIDYENFNAASANVHVHGLSIHPGSAKNKMKNSLLMAMEFQQLLPTFDNPAFTEGYEGFNHLTKLQGDCEYALMHYIIRNHDEKLLEKQKEDFRNAADFMNRKYGKGTIVLEIEDSYRNMRSYIENRMEIIELASNAISAVGLTPKSQAIRGGTDGASLTYMGLCCPNLGTGGRQCHGKFEYASINEMKMASDILMNIVNLSVK